MFIQKKCNFNKGNAIPILKKGKLPRAYWNE